MLQFDLSEGYVNQQQQILSGMTLGEINELAGKYLDTNKMTILIVGDKARILSGLEKLGYRVIEVDDNGRLKS